MLDSNSRGHDAPLRDKTVPSFDRWQWRPGDPMFWVVYLEIYLQSVKTRANRDSGNPDHVESVLRRFTQYCQLETRQLIEIQSIDLELYVGKRRGDTYRGKPLSEVTINNEIRIINAAFRRAGPRTSGGTGRRNLGFIAEERHVPWAEFLPEFQNIVRTAKPEQIEQFIQASATATTPCPEVCDPALFWQCVLLLELVTRLRRKALLEILRPDDDVLYRRMEIFLPAKLSKGIRRDQVIGLGEGETGRRVVEILGRLPSKPGERFLPWKGRDGLPLTKEHFSNMVTRIQKDHGLGENERFRIKDLRSTGGSTIARHFGDAVAKTALGHSATTNTLHKHYFDPTPASQDRQASNLMAQLALPFVECPEDPSPETLRFPSHVG